MVSLFFGKNSTIKHEFNFFKAIIDLLYNIHIFTSVYYLTLRHSKDVHLFMYVWVIYVNHTLHYAVVGAEDHADR